MPAEGRLSRMEDLSRMIKQRSLLLYSCVALCLLFGAFLAWNVLAIWRLLTAQPQVDEDSVARVPDATSPLESDSVTFERVLHDQDASPTKVRHQEESDEICRRRPVGRQCSADPGAGGGRAVFAPEMD